MAHIGGNRVCIDAFVMRGPGVRLVESVRRNSGYWRSINTRPDTSMAICIGPGLDLPQRPRAWPDEIRQRQTCPRLSILFLVIDDLVAVGEERAVRPPH